MTTNNPTAVATTAATKLEKSMSKSSLDEFVQSARRSLLIVDCSGSMGECIRSGGTKIQALRKVVASLRETHPVPVAAFGHRTRGRDVVEVVDTIPEPAGGTPLHEAIRFGRVNEANHLVVVTDGCADSESHAFAEARAFGGPIDVFYIGDGNDRGARFAQELAQMTGGTANLTDLGKPKELSGKIALLLGDGSSL